MALSNPLLDAWKTHSELIELRNKEYLLSQKLRCRKTTKNYDQKILELCRDKSVLRYSWAIPTEEVFEIIAKYSKNLVEIGSGNGYWANLLRQYGVCVTAVDNGREYGWKNLWIHDTIRMDGTEYLKQSSSIPHDSLLLVWPRETQCFVNAFRGKYVIWVGELDGCTGSIQLEQEDMLYEWKEVNRCQIPQWRYIDDVLIVYERGRLL